MSELAAAADHLASLLESLKHEKHASALRPLHAKVRRIFARRFRSQKAALLKELEPWLRRMAEQRQEASAIDAAKRARMQAAVTAKINASAALAGEWPEKDVTAYDAAVTSAARAAATRMVLDYEIQVAKDAGNRYAAEYLRDHAFSQLAADIDTVTRDRMSNAVADVYAKGGSYNDAVEAIRESFAEMTTSRADTIARTELADAYNSAMLESAKEAGDLLKTWNAEGPDPCPECIANEDQGSLALDEDFQSGHEAPPAHPNCLCSVGFVKS